jgi:hypothetical protein
MENYFIFNCEIEKSYFRKKYHFRKFHFSSEKDTCIFFLIKQINIIFYDKLYLRERKNSGTWILILFKQKKVKFQPQNLNPANASIAWMDGISMQISRQLTFTKNVQKKFCSYNIINFLFCLSCKNNMFPSL